VGGYYVEGEVVSFSSSFFIIDFLFYSAGERGMRADVKMI
jgi:hypothetical protein